MTVTAERELALMGQALGLEDVFAQIGSAWDAVERKIAIAGEAIGAAQAARPELADTLYHAFALMTPTHERMDNPMVYSSHVRELLERVIKGEDTRLGTAAEVCIACMQTSQLSPLNSAGAGLYFRMWQQAFPDHPIETPGASMSERGEHYEALYASRIDDSERETRRRLAREDRRLVRDCTGTHHGEPAPGCRWISETG